jgi:hypothetical protein
MCTKHWIEVISKDHMEERSVKWQNQKRLSLTSCKSCSLSAGLKQKASSTLAIWKCCYSHSWVHGLSERTCLDIPSSLATSILTLLFTTHSPFEVKALLLTSNQTLLFPLRSLPFSGHYTLATPNSSDHFGQVIEALDYFCFHRALSWCLPFSEVQVAGPFSQYLPASFRNIAPSKRHLIEHCYSIVFSNFNNQAFWAIPCQVHICRTFTSLSSYLYVSLVLSP